MVDLNKNPHRRHIQTALAASPLFADMGARETGLVADFARYNSYQKGHVVFVEGDYAANFFVVAAGEIKVYKTSPEGREVIIKVMRAGDLVGEAAALGGRRYPATAQALTAAAAVEIPRADFVALIQKQPRLALNMIASLSQRLQQVNAIIEKLTLKEVPGRLASFLLQNARPSLQGGKVVELAVKKADLAAEMGTVPETLSRALKKFADAGFIVIRDKSIYLNNEEALSQLADGY